MYDIGLGTSLQLVQPRPALFLLVTVRTAGTHIWPWLPSWACPVCLPMGLVLPARAPLPSPSPWLPAPHPIQSSQPLLYSQLRLFQPWAVAVRPGPWSNVSPWNIPVGTLIWPGTHMPWPCPGQSWAGCPSEGLCKAWGWPCCEERLACKHKGLFFPHWGLAAGPKGPVLLVVAGTDLTVKGEMPGLTPALRYCSPQRLMLRGWVQATAWLHHRPAPAQAWPCWPRPSALTKDEFPILIEASPVTIRATSFPGTWWALALGSPRLLAPGKQHLPLLSHSHAVGDSWNQTQQTSATYKTLPSG